MTTKKPKKRVRVYVAGPMSKGDTIGHWRAAIDVARWLRGLGYVPVTPQNSHMDAFAYPGVVSHSEWLDEDYTHLSSCQLMVRLPGESTGADQEEVWASEMGIPVYPSVSALQEVHGREEDCRDSLLVDSNEELLAALDDCMDQLAIAQEQVKALSTRGGAA